MHQAGIKSQAANVPSSIPTNREDKTDLNEALLVLTIVPTNKVKVAKKNDEKHNIVNEALNTNAPGLQAVPKSLETLFIAPRTAKFLAERSNDPLCRQLTSTVGTPGSDYSQNCIGILILRATIDGAIQKNRSTIAIGARYTRVSLPTATWTTCRKWHVRYHAMEGILASRGH